MRAMSERHAPAVRRKVQAVRHVELEARALADAKAVHTVGKRHPRGPVELEMDHALRAGDLGDEYPPVHRYAAGGAGHDVMRTQAEQVAPILQACRRLPRYPGRKMHAPGAL